MEIIVPEESKIRPRLRQTLSKQISVQPCQHIWLCDGYVVRDGVAAGGDTRRDSNLYVIWQLQLHGLSSYE
jgi:hypothetical protein